MNQEDLLVSAIMITSGAPLRQKLSRVAIECFRKQTHPNTELIVINHGPPLDVVGKNIRQYQHEKETLGDLRNLGIRHSDGDYCISFDDDDWHHPERISYQLSQALSENKKASVLGCFTVVDTTTGERFVRSCRAFKCGGCCSTILFKRDLPKYAYPPLNRKEDSVFADKYRADDQLVVAADSPPLMYVRLYHGQNTSPAGQVLSKRYRRRLSPHDSKALSGIVQTIADVGGLQIPGVTE